MDVETRNHASDDRKIERKKEKVERKKERRQISICMILVNTQKQATGWLGRLRGRMIEIDLGRLERGRASEWP